MSVLRPASNNSFPTERIFMKISHSSIFLIPVEKIKVSLESDKNIRPSTSIEELDFHWTDFHENFTFDYFCNICRENSSFIRIWQEYPSFHQHRTTRFPLDGFSWNFPFEYFSNICRENWSFITIWQEYPSFDQHRTTRFPMDGFSWNFYIWVFL